MSEEKSFELPKSLHGAESVESTIARKVQQIKSKFDSSKQNVAAEDVDCFIQELTGYSKVLKVTSKTEVCSDYVNVLLGDITDLVQLLSQFKSDLQQNRQVISKIIDMETEILKIQAIWRKLPFAEQVSQENHIRKDILRIIEDVGNIQMRAQCNKRLNELSKMCSKMLQEIKLTISNMENFNIQLSELQRQYESVKISHDIGKALPNLKDIQSAAESLQEVNEESKVVKHDFISKINQDIEKFIDIQTNKKKLTDLLELFSTVWRQIENDLNTNAFDAVCLNEAQTKLIAMRNSIDKSAKVLKEKTTNGADEELENSDVFQRTFKHIKGQIRVASNEDDGSQFLQFASDLRNLLSQIINHQSLLKEVEHYTDALEREANILNYLFGMEAKADEIDNLFGNGESIDVIQRELEGFQSMIKQNSFNTLISKSKERKSKLLERVNNQVYRLEQLKVKAGQDQFKAEHDLKEVEDMRKIVEPKVKTFVGLKNDTQYFEFKERITRSILQLDGIKIQNDEIQTKKVNLLKKLHELGDELECRTAAAERVHKLDTRIRDTLVFIQHTNLVTEKEQFKQFETTICELEEERKLLIVNDQLKDKIDECDQNLNVLVRLIFGVEEAEAL